MPMLAELVDAVVGVDTHRDTHQVEIALPNGAPIAVTTISNDSSGYAELLAWIVDHAPGPRLVVSIEGTRSYGVGLARAAAAAGLIVLECEQPHRNTRRGKGKSDPIDAHLAVLTALRLNADRLPTPARTATGRRCGSCSARARNSPPPVPRRPTGCGHCCWAGMTPTASSPAARSPTPAWPAWPGAGHREKPAPSRPSGTRRSAASPSPCARPPARSRPTAPSCRPSSATSSPG